MSFRFHREARNLVVTMLVAVAGALAAWALASFKTESWKVVTFFLVVACVLAIAATVLMCWTRNSEEPGKNNKKAVRRADRSQDSRKSAKQRRSAPGNALGP